MNRKLWEAMRSVPGNSEAWFALGIAAVEASRFDEAKFALVHAVELAPRDADRAVSAAWQLASSGCSAEAERIFRNLLVHCPDRLDVRVGLAQVLLSTGEERAALEEIEHALRAEPHQIPLRLLAADAHDRLGEPTRAIEQLEHVLAEDVDHPDANRRLATLLSRTGQHQGAIRCWRRLVVGASGDELEARTMLGIELSRDGQHEEALAILEDVAARDPRSGSARANLGMALLQAQQLDQAVEAFQAALALEPRSAQAYCGLGLAYQRLQRFADAAQAFRATEQLAPDSPNGPLNLALALDELGEREEARLALLRAAELAPEDQEIRHALEQFLARPTPSSPNGERVRPAQFGVSITGDLESFQLFDVLEFLRLQSKTGSLVLSSRRGTGVIRLTGGAVTSASAPGIMRLGEALLERGLLTAEQLEDALGVQQESRMWDESPEALGAVLLSSKVVDRGQLGKVVFQQVLDALDFMTQWSDGAFSFHPAAASDVPPPISFSVQQVLLELMRQSDERNEAARMAGQ